MAPVTAEPAQTTGPAAAPLPAATAEPVARSPSGALDPGILPQLVGRTWIHDRGIKATITLNEDGRYKAKVLYDTHYIDLGVAGAPTTKSSLGGTVLLESDYRGGANGFGAAVGRKSAHLFRGQEEGGGA